MAPTLSPSLPISADALKGYLIDAFDWIATWQKADHWKLSDRYAQRLADPLSELIGSVWAKMGGSMPSFIDRWIAEYPGLFGTIMACAVVFGPRWAKQMELTRNRPPAVSHPSQPSNVINAPSEVPTMIFHGA